MTEDINLSRSYNELLILLDILLSLRLASPMYVISNILALSAVSVTYGA